MHIIHTHYLILNLISPFLFNLNFNRALFAGQLQAECKDVNFEALILKSQHICDSNEHIDWSTDF